MKTAQRRFSVMKVKSEVGHLYIIGLVHGKGASLLLGCSKEGNGRRMPQGEIHALLSAGVK